MTLKIDTTEFQKALRQHLLTSKRELSEALNFRMYYVLMRAMLLTPPNDPDAKRRAVKEELTQEKFVPIDLRIQKSTKRLVVKTRAKIRSLQARHLIIHTRRRESGKPPIGKGMKRGAAYADMRKAAGDFLRGAVNSVGYLKAVIVIGIRRLLSQQRKTFTQFGTVINPKTRPGQTVKRVNVPTNSLLVGLAQKYGHAFGNVGVHKNAKADVLVARPGLNPTVTVNLSFGTSGNPRLSGAERAEQILTTSFTRAFEDERVEMLEHMRAAVMNSAADAGFST